MVEIVLPPPADLQAPSGLVEGLAVRVRRVSEEDMEVLRDRMEMKKVVERAVNRLFVFVMPALPLLLAVTDMCESPRA